MNYDFDKIMEALKTIKEVCAESSKGEDCFECPFGDYMGGCSITNDIPEEWVLNAQRIIKPFL